MEKKVAKTSLISALIGMSDYLWQQAKLEVNEHDTWVFVRTDFIKLNADLISIFVQQESNLEDEDDEIFDIEEVLDTINREVTDLFKKEEYFIFKSSMDYDEFVMNRFNTELVIKNLIKIEEYSVTELS